jgi:hypothetical protein
VQWRTQPAGEGGTMVLMISDIDQRSEAAHRGATVFAANT